MSDMLHARVPREVGQPLRTFEVEYLQLLDYIMKCGEDRADRTGTGTRAVFGEKIVIDLEEGFPLLTTKTVPFKSVLTELLWFLEGSADERRLAELLHGTRDPSKKTVWSPNAEATTGSKFKPAYPGDLGRVYGVQWRKWQHLKLKSSEDNLSHENGGMTYFGAKVLVEELDQVKELVNKLKTNPTDRRIILTAWNPGELSEMALPPCHMFAQFYLSNDRKLSCQMYQRSVDSFLGLPFNIASYALLTHMIAHVIGASVGELHMVLGDTHIYKDHVEQVREQLSRPPRRLPILNIKRQVTDIDDFKVEDFELLCYDPHPAIKARMAA
jgi:thymidylate synthase